MHRFEEAVSATVIIRPAEQGTDKNIHSRQEKAPTLARRVIRLIGKTALGTAVTVGALTAALQYDIYQGREDATHSHPSIDHVYDPMDTAYSDAATILLPGFGTRSALDAAERLDAHADMGHVFSLEYSNNTIDIDELTATVIDGLKRQKQQNSEPIRYLRFDGYSMGGIVMLAVAAAIHENYPEYIITSVTLNSTPVGEHGLTTGSSHAIDQLGNTVDFCRTIKLCQGIEYSRLAQRVIEIASRHNEYITNDTGQFNLDNFRQSFTQVNRKLSTDNAPGPFLAYSQASVLEGASDDMLQQAQQQFNSHYGIERSIAALSTPHQGAPAVKIFYTMADTPSSDTVVAVDESAKALATIAQRYNIKLTIVPLDVGHVDIYSRKAQYNQFIADSINPLTRLTVQDPVVSLATLPDTFAVSGLPG